MDTQTENRPPGMPGAVLGIERERAATHFNEPDYSSSTRYCKPVPLCLLVDALLDKIEKAMVCREALHVDGFELLQLHDDYLPLWLSDAPSIVASDILVGKAIRAAFAAAGIKPPPIYIQEPRHG